MWNIEGEGLTHDESVLLSQISRKEMPRITSGPWDFTFGGGLFATTTVLVGGTPGAGKTTLFLQMANAMEGEPMIIIAEQSKEEVALTADRLGVTKEIRIVPAINGVNVNAILHRYKPSIVMLDSLQGLVGKDDQAQCEICKIAKVHSIRLGAPFLIVSHVTKDEMLSGTMTLQHEVDVTAMFFLDDNERILTTLKSRIGPAFLETRFKMTERGLSHVGWSKPGETPQKEKA